jgi:SIT4-associating protein SAP185/190
MSSRYSYISCEVLSCEIWSICETVVQNRELLSTFWAFLDRPSPLNPLQASYFTKVNEQFLEKKTDEVCSVPISLIWLSLLTFSHQMIPFIQSIPNIVPKLLRHIETSAIMDLLLKIISMEKSEPGAGIVEVYPSKLAVAVD